MNERGIINTLEAVGGDGCNTNTGNVGGVFQWIEKKCGKKLVWLICCLHSNEHPLRHLIENLNGKTLSNNKWSGNISQVAGLCYRHGYQQLCQD